MMVASLPDVPLTTQQAHLDALAQAWLAAGAQAFGVWLDGAPLALWPPDATLAAPGLFAAVNLPGGNHLELRVEHEPTQANRLRLQSDLSLVAALLTSESELALSLNELVDTRDHLVALYEMAEATRQSLKVRDTLTRLATVVARIINVQAAALLLDLPGRVRYLVQHPEPIFPAAALRKTIDQLRVEKQAYLWMETNWSALSDRDCLVLPLDVHGAQRAGLVLLVDKKQAGASPEVKLARAIAKYASMQIENIIFYHSAVEFARLQTEMELAQNVQSSLLPKDVPHVPDLDVWSLSRPADRVGGDFYDFVYSPDGRFYFVVGDISGKGIPAALVMAMTRSILRAQTKAQNSLGPRVVLGQANEHLYDDLTELGAFATLFVGQYDPQPRALTYANAGHSPVIYIPQGGTARLLEADGPPVGILPKSLSQSYRLDWNPGDVLVIGTDGLTDVENAAGERFGYERLVEQVESLSGLPASAIGASIQQVLARFGHNLPQEDDQTLVVIKYQGNEKE